MSDIANHQRINDILLGPLERPALKWLASHMPAWVTPDICTITGLLGAVVTMVGYILSTYHRGFLWLASLGFVINWLGDSLDGNLARHRHIERPIFGFFVDHTVDVATEVMIFLGLGLTPYVNFTVACLTLVGYLMLSVLVYIRTSVVGEFKISYSKLGPTEIRVLAILLNTFMYFGGMQTISWTPWNMVQLSFTPYDILVAGIVLLLLVFFIQTSIKETIRLARAGQ
jgi:phosphatidylglycerophosphate synthase